MSNIDYAHLHLHTDYSLLDGAIQIKPLAERVKELGMKACAMTDHGNMYGAVSFYKEMKAHDVRPIIGCEVYLAPGHRSDKSEVRKGGKPYNHMILLAKDREGYHNLVRLTSTAFRDGFFRSHRVRPRRGRRQPARPAPTPPHAPWRSRRCATSGAP